MTAPNCDHCLRTDFTRRLAKELLADRRPLNLIGAPGQGRGRLLVDLQQIDGDGTRWLCADLKAHRYSFSGLLKTLWDQTGLPGAQPRTLGALVERLVAEGQHACLLLHHFDSVLNKPDVGAGFDVGFLDVLAATPVERMTNRLKTGAGRAAYALHKQTVEPVFGIISSKSVIDFRQFLTRGLDNVQGEWTLICLAWNLKRMAVLRLQSGEHRGKLRF